MSAVVVTLQSVLLRRLADEPDAEACRLVAEDGTCESISVSRLLRKAMAYANAFGRVPGSRKTIAVALYHGVDLHAAFLGGLLAGHVPTMLAPPSPRMEPAKYTDSFVQMLQHIRPDTLVTDARVLAELDRLALREAGGASLVDPATVPDEGDIEPPDAAPDDIALVQHSSGTTGLQKGVALTHRAVLEHNRIYCERLRIRRGDVIVSWLPLYHDMGFIACFLLPLLERVLFVEISPFDWVRKPLMLLEQIHAHRGTLCWLPNFAYSFMAQSVRPRSIPQDLDVSSIRAWVNCSEPVYHSSHAAFLEKFGRYGVTESQLTASYAMAENVFAVTQSLPGRYRTLRVDRALFTASHRVHASDAPGSLAFVSNGEPLPHTFVEIADEAGRLPPGVAGEILIRGAHRFDGYYGRADLTAAALDADGWYRTGDIGFLLDGELYVTGRKKDLIIIQGRNFYPSDIEGAVGRVDGVVAGRVAAFGVSDETSGTEQLVILAESAAAGGDAKRLALAIRNHVAQELDCTPSDVRIVPERWLVKSTSGKLARLDNRRKYIEHFLSGRQKA